MLLVSAKVRPIIFVLALVLGFSSFASSFDCSAPLTHSHGEAAPLKILQGGFEFSAVAGVPGFYLPTEILGHIKNIRHLNNAATYASAIHKADGSLLLYMPRANEVDLPFFKGVILDKQKNVSGYYVPLSIHEKFSDALARKVKAYRSGIRMLLTEKDPSIWKQGIYENTPKTILPLVKLSLNKFLDHQSSIDANRNIFIHLVFNETVANQAKNFNLAELLHVLDTDPNFPIPNVVIRSTVSNEDKIFRSVYPKTEEYSLAPVSEDLIAGAAKKIEQELLVLRNLQFQESQKSIAPLSYEDWLALLPKIETSVRVKDLARIHTVNSSSLEDHMQRALEEYHSTPALRDFDLLVDAIRENCPGCLRSDPKIFLKIRQILALPNPQFDLRESFAQLFKLSKSKYLASIEEQIFSLLNEAMNRAAEQTIPMEIRENASDSFLPVSNGGLSAQLHVGASVLGLSGDFDLLSRKTKVDDSMVSETDAAFLSSMRGLTDFEFSMEKDSGIFAQPARNKEKVFALNPRDVIGFNVRVIAGGMLKNSARRFATKNDSRWKELKPRYYSLVLPHGFVERYSMAIKPGETHTWSELKRDSDFKNKFFLSAIERGRRQIHTKIRWTNFIVNGERMSQFDFLRKHVIAVVEWDQDFNITRVKRFD